MELTFILLIIFLLLIAIGFYIERSKRSVTLILWPFLFFLLWVPLFLEAAGLLKFKSQDLLFPLVLSIAFTAFYIIGFYFTYHIARRKKVLEQVGLLNPSPLIIFSCIVLIFLILIWQGLSANMILTSTWRSKLDLGIYSLFIFWLLAAMSGQFFISILKKKFIFSAIIMTTFLVVAVYFRSRAILGIMLIPFLIHYLRHPSLNKVRIFLISVVLLVAAIGLRLMRFQGELSNIEFSVLLNYISIDLIRELFESGDFSVYQYFLLLVRDCEQYLSCFNFSFFQTYLDKTGLIQFEDSRLTYYLFEMYYEKGIGGSLHPTLFGFVYGDFNVFGGICFMLALGCFNACFTKMGIYYQILIIGFISQYVFFISRGSVFNAFVDLFAGFIFLSIIWILKKIKYRKTNAKCI